MKYRYWEKLTENSKEIIYKSKNKEVWEEGEDFTNYLQVRATVTELKEGGYDTRFVSVITMENDDVLDIHMSRSIKSGFSNKSKALSYLSNILRRTDFALAADFVEGELDRADLERSYDTQRLEDKVRKRTRENLDKFDDRHADLEDEAWSIVEDTIREENIDNLNVEDEDYLVEASIDEATP